MDTQALEFFFNIKGNMEEPYFSYLVMMFKELDVFSIPEIGTFIRVVHPATKVGNEIIAPKEEFIYDYKEEYKQETAQFLAERLQISLKEGKQVLEDISRHMFRYFDYVSRDLLIPGIGIVHHIPKNDTFLIKNSEEIRLNTYGMKDMIIDDTQTETKKNWKKNIFNWIKRINKRSNI